MFFIYEFFLLLFENELLKLIFKVPETLVSFKFYNFNQDNKNKNKLYVLK